MAKTKLVIFGITGDLSTRKLLPALDHLVSSGDLTNMSIIGVSRREVDVPNLIKSAIKSDRLVDLTSIFTMDLAERADYDRLKDHVDLQTDEQLLVYLSVPPQAATQIVDFLGEAGLNGENVKLLFEKPFGFDYATAQDVIARTARYFSEQQIYRIDHYMAKQLAGDIMKLQGTAKANLHSWSKQSIASIQILAAESIGIEDRATFYEQTGALRDFVQGHLLQLLALVLLHSPDDVTMEKLPGLRLLALQSVASVDPRSALRAQYDGYQAEVDNSGSRVETFVRLTLVSRDDTWAGVPIELVTGKKLHDKVTQITVTYKDGTTDILDESTYQTDGRTPDAYERVLLEAVNGDKAIFTTSQEVLEAWRILGSVQLAWQNDAVPLYNYEVGSTPESVSDSNPQVA